MSKINDVTNPKELALLSEDDLLNEHMEATMELAHFVREKLHAEYHIRELDCTLFHLDEELERREEKSRLTLVK